jgi:LmbE family N-acetylglucosaminyl deacetylase
MKVIAIGAHPDDIEIGCGGTLAAHVQSGATVSMVVMTAGEKGGADRDTRLGELQEAARILGAVGVHCLGYPDTCVPTGIEAIEKLEQVINRYQPDRAYIPFWREVHQDHRHTAEVALAACRNIPQVLMYEGPSTFPDFVVNYFADIGNTLEQKTKAICCHKSQGEKENLKIGAIQGLNRFRGYQSHTEYAEGFAIFRYIERL